MPTQRTLFSLDFVCTCLVMFLTYCNITVFYNLYPYLEQIGIDARWRGFLIGSSSLATMALFLSASPFLTVARAVPCATAGALTLMGCGFAYLVAGDVATLLAVRLLHGAAIYLLSASCMTLMVSRLPPQHSGQAFSLYSVALLLPYSLVPAVCDLVVPHLPSAAYGYRDMALLLVPGLAMIWLLGRRRRAAADQAAPARPMSLGEMYKNAGQPAIALVLALNAIYIVAFSSLFFMAKGLFQSRGHADVGLYFTIQMCCMMAIRLGANRLFDRVRKVRLIRLSFLLSAASFLLAARATTLAGLYGSSLVMGIGMGVSSPALYGLMFDISPARFKTVNSNLMMLSLQIGNFLGPFLGAAAMHSFGYAGMLEADAVWCLGGVALCSVLTSRKVDVGGMAARA
ncbi:MAG: MFS transporter [Solidesulfovibrio sp.]|uniref:MFS transporter n=2 Tax=Solidesulfovibrio sp. TaxID=2910990 RepID=UPI0031597A29